MSKINLIDLQKRKFQASYLAWFVFTKNIKLDFLLVLKFKLCIVFMALIN